MNTVRIVCRQSRLSLLQAEIVKQKIIAAFPDMEVLITGHISRGDRELDVPLSSLDGSDFFTKEIFELLRNGNADLAVHSMKDMSADHFFSHDAFAVPVRDDVRDVVIFNTNIEHLLRSGKEIRIGTSSPRREDMAVHFLKKGLPQLGPAPDITTCSIRGNVESRLRQLDEGKFDGTILATAGLNRLLRGPDHRVVSGLLSGKPMMILPLVECVPAPCQGAILVEADPANKLLRHVLEAINDLPAWKAAVQEKQWGQTYGRGCLQRFGVTTIRTGGREWMYAGGTDEHGKEFSDWQGLPVKQAGVLFSSTEHMRSFFSYEWKEKLDPVNTPAVFVANYKILQHPQAKALLERSQIWASGTKTWFELSKKGYWVKGSADALGYENMLEAMTMPLVGLEEDQITILTHAEAAQRWSARGRNAVSIYRLIPSSDQDLANLIAKADQVFWTSYSQYAAFGRYCRPDVVHMACAGETANLLMADGIEPVIFPTIKAFQQWSRSTILQHNEG